MLFGEFWGFFLVGRIGPAYSGIFDNPPKSVMSGYKPDLLFFIIFFVFGFEFFQSVDGQFIGIECH